MSAEPEYRLLEGFEPHLEIEVTLLRPEEGGGSGPWLAFLRSDDGERAETWRPGYTPPFYYDGAYWIAFYLFAQEVIHPGDTVKALACFLNPEFHALHRANLYPGKEIELREGDHAMARGRVTRLLGFS